MSTQTSGQPTDGTVDRVVPSGDETPRWRRIGSRLAWAAGAQASSSATNLALYVGILVSTDTAGLGRWVAVLGVYHLALALSRSLASEPMVAAGRATTEDRSFSWTWARRRHQVIGLVAGLGAVAVGWLIDADPRTVVAVAVATPALLVQDGFRYLAWAGRRPVLAIALDLIWLVVTGAAVVALVLTDGIGPVPVVWSWLAGGLVSALAGRLLLGRLLAAASLQAITPGSGTSAADQPGAETTADGGGDRAPEASRHGRRVSHAMLVTARNLLPVVLALVAGPVPAGLVKAALLPFTPILTLFGGLRIAMLPAMQRAADADPDAETDADSGAARPTGRTNLDRFLGRVLAAYAGVAVGAVVATIAVVTVVSDRVGALEAMSPQTVRFGGLIAVMTILIRPVAEAVALGRPRVSAPRRRLGEIGIEWGGVFAAALLVDPDQVVIGWAVGMALGGLLWVAAMMRPAPVPTAGKQLPAG